jgi:hypothetical protein
VAVEQPDPPPPHRGQLGHELLDAAAGQRARRCRSRHHLRHDLVGLAQQPGGGHRRGKRIRGAEHGEPDPLGEQPARHPQRFLAR